jgi:Domain of unknown function (DUF4193)
MDETEERVEIEDSEEDGDEEPDEEAVAAAAAPAAGGEEVESSLEELLAKKEDRKPGEEDDDEESMLSLGREERLEPLAVKVVPPQPSEFVCKKCYLVKHRSQLADRTRMYCRDCA